MIYRNKYLSEYILNIQYNISYNILNKFKYGYLELI